MNIKLTQGKFTIVDDEDVPILSRYRWCAAKAYNTFYAVAWYRGMGKNLVMHRLLLGLSEGDHRVIDHINGDGLDNRKANLRVCTNRQNEWNKQKHADNSSGHLGISFEKRSGLWRVALRNDGKDIVKRRANLSDAIGVHGDLMRKYRAGFINRYLDEQ